MRRKPLVIVPPNGDSKAELDFENEYGFVFVHGCEHLDIVKTLITNRIHRNKDQGILFPYDEFENAHILDHIALYKNKSGKLFFTTQPYLGPEKFISNARGKKEIFYPVAEAIASFSKWCRKNGFNMDVKIPGPHNENTTLFIVSKMEEEI